MLRSAISLRARLRPVDVTGPGVAVARHRDVVPIRVRDGPGASENRFDPRHVNLNLVVAPDRRRVDIDGDLPLR